MKIVVDATSVESMKAEFPKKETCWSCGSVIEYDMEDVRLITNSYDTFTRHTLEIRCPACKVCIDPGISKGAKITLLNLLKGQK